MFEGLFGQEDDESSWEASPPVVSRGGKAPVSGRGQGQTPFIGLSNQYALYFTPEFRHGIYAIGEEEMKVELRQGEVPSTSTGTTAATDSTPKMDTSDHGQTHADAFLTEADEAQLQLLSSMGFEESRIRAALKKFSSSDDPTGERKMEWLLEGGGTETIGDEGDAENGSFDAGFGGLVDTQGDDEWIGGMMGMMDDEEDEGKTKPDIATDPRDLAQPSQSSSHSSTDKKDDISPSPTSLATDFTPTTPQFKVRLVPKALQSLFATLQLGDLSHGSTEDLTASFNWKASHTREQHDVHELARVLMDVIERSLKGTSQQNLVKSLFHGSQCHQIICRKCKTIKERSETFGDLTLAIPRGVAFLDQASSAQSSDTSSTNGGSGKKKNKKQGQGSGDRSGGPGTSLEMCMAHYFGTEVLEGRNQYECDNCGTKTDAEIGMRLKKLPKVLCLSLARMEYDYRTGNRVKNTSKVSFPPSIDVASFMAERSSSSSGESLHIGNSHESAHGEEQSGSTIFDLYAVLIHKGASASSGHYHVYIKDLLGLASSSYTQGEKIPEDIVPSSTSAESPSSNSTTQAESNIQTLEESSTQGEAEDRDSQEQEGDEKDISESKADGKRRRKTKASSSTTSTSSSSKSKSSGASEEALAWARSDLESDSDRLALSGAPYPSKWFDFDDTRVTVIEASKVPSTFSSNECAYMFFYKQRPTASSTAASQPSFELDPPPYVIEQMLELNSKLAAEREAYEQKMNEIEVQVVLPHHLVSYQHNFSQFDKGDSNYQETRDTALEPSMEGRNGSEPGSNMTSMTQPSDTTNTSQTSTLATSDTCATSKPSDCAGPPLLKWVHEEIQKGNLIVPPDEQSIPPSSNTSWPSSSLLLSPLTLIIDQRKPFRDLVALLKPIYDEYHTILLSLLPESDQPSTKNQFSTTSIHFDLVRSYHDRVMIERSFLLDPETFSPLQHASSPSSDSTTPISTSTSINDTLLKNLDMAKKQSILIWDGSHFNAYIGGRTMSDGSSMIQQVEMSGSEVRKTQEEATSTLKKTANLRLPMLTCKLPDASDTGNILVTPWSTLELRVYGTSNEDSVSRIKEGFESTLFDLFDQEGAPWNHVCVGSITVVSEKKLEASPGRSVSMFTLHVKIPSSTPISRLDGILKRCSLVNSLIYGNGNEDARNFQQLSASSPSLEILQPPASLEPSSLDESQEYRISHPASSCHSSIQAVASTLDAIKSQWRDREGLIRDADIPPSSPALGPPPPPILHATSPIIIAYRSLSIGSQDDTSSPSSSADVSSIILSELQASTRRLLSLGSSSSGDDEEGDARVGHGGGPPSASSGNNKKSKSLDLYVILGLKLSKSSFLIGPPISSPSSPLSSGAGLLRLNQPLPDSTSSPTTASDDAGSFHPRYIVRDVRENMTLRELVEHISSEEVTNLPKPPQLAPHLRLFSVDAFDQKDRLYDNMNMTVKSAMLTAYQTLWLEEGSEPKSGLLQLSLHLFRLNPNPVRVRTNKKEEKKKKKNGEENSAEAKLTSYHPPCSSSPSSPLSTFPTTRPNLLMIPLALEMTTSGGEEEEKKKVEDVPGNDTTTTSETPLTTTTTDQQAPPPPPPPPPPPKSTCLRLETTLTSTLGSLKDQVASEIERIVLTSSSNRTPPPFDFFMASSPESKRRSISIWIEDHLMLGDEKELKTWRLNSHSRFNLAVILSQSILSLWPTTQEENQEGEAEEEEKEKEMNMSLANVGEAVPTVLFNEQQQQHHHHHHHHDASQEEEEREGNNKGHQTFQISLANPSFSISSPPSPSSILIFFRRRVTNPSNPVSRQYGPLTCAWISTSASSASSSSSSSSSSNSGPNKNKKARNQGSKKGRGNAAEQSSQLESGSMASARASPSPSHIMLDLESIVDAFSRMEGGDRVSVPPEWLLMAKIGIHPHNHDMQLPKWQLLWKPAAYLDQAEEGPLDTMEQVQGKEKDVSSASSQALSSPSIVQDDVSIAVESLAALSEMAENGAGSHTEKDVEAQDGLQHMSLASQHHHHILMKHLSDPKTPCAVQQSPTAVSSVSKEEGKESRLPETNSMPSPDQLPSTSTHNFSGPDVSSSAYSFSNSSVGRRKVKVVHGDVFVLDDARNWSLDTHDDIFWDNQRRLGAGAGGNGEDQYMSDLERALLESTKSAYRRNTAEVALTIHIDDF